MHEIGAFEAKNKLSACSNAWSAGGNLDHRAASLLPSLFRR